MDRFGVQFVVGELQADRRDCLHNVENLVDVHRYLLLPDVVFRLLMHLVCHKADLRGVP